MISDDSVRCAVVDSFGQGQPLSTGLGCHHVQRFINQVFEAKRLVLQLYLIIFSPGKVQDIVDYCQKSLASFSDAFDVSLILCEVIIQKEA